jgi:hypothetical protein
MKVEFFILFYNGLLYWELKNSFEYAEVYENGLIPTALDNPLYLFPRAV